METSDKYLLCLIILIIIVGAIVMLSSNRCPKGGYHKHDLVSSEEDSLNVLNQGLFTDRHETRYYTHDTYKCRKCGDTYRETNSY